MLETIFEWLVSAVGEAMEALINAFMGLLELDIGTVSAQFPFLSRTYGIFRVMGIGLVIVFASVSLFKFGFGPLSESKDTPIQILFRAAIAIGLIYFGGYIVEWVVNIAKLPYDHFLNMEAVSKAAKLDVLEDAQLSDGAPVVFTAASLLSGSAIPIALGAAALLIVTLIALVVIFINVIKLIIEVCQRFMWLFVMMYTAPLAFSTFTSKNTSEILKKWISMFLSQCLLLILSVWLLKAVVSGFSAPEGVDSHNFMFQFLMTLALCKIGANIDREIQRIGLNPTTASGNVFEEIKGAAGFVTGALTAPGSIGEKASNAVLGAASAASNKISGQKEEPLTVEQLKKDPFGSVARFTHPIWKRGNQEHSGGGSQEGNASPTPSGGAGGSSVTGTVFEGGSIENKKGRVSLSSEAKAQGAFIDSSNKVTGPQISSPSPKTTANVFANSLGQVAQGGQGAKVITNTARAMPTEAAMHVLSDASHPDVPSGTADAPLHEVVKKTLAQTDIGQGRDPQYSKIAISRDQHSGLDAQTGTVMTQAYFKSPGIDGGQDSMATIVNKGAFDQMSDNERVGYKEVVGSEGGLFVKKENVTSQRSTNPEIPTSRSSSRPPSKSQH